MSATIAVCNVTLPIFSIPINSTTHLQRQRMAQNDRSSTHPKDHQSFPLKANKISSNQNAFLFLPNLIGYTRIILLFISLGLMQIPRQKFTSIVFYAFSCLLDAIDGHVARAFGQSTKFGAVLDMVTDRLSTSCLLMTLCGHFKSMLWRLVFQVLFSLDIFSHWMLMYASLVKGLASHKQTPKNYNFLVRLYYAKKHVMFVVCAGCELFYLGLFYLGAFHWKLFPLMALCAFKQVTNVLQLVESSKELVR